MISGSRWACRLKDDDISRFHESRDRLGRVHDEGQVRAVVRIARRGDTKDVHLGLTRLRVGAEAPSTESRLEEHVQVRFGHRRMTGVDQFDHVRFDVDAVHGVATRGEDRRSG